MALSRFACIVWSADRFVVCSEMRQQQRWDLGPGIKVVGTEHRPDKRVVTAESAGQASCPGCGSWSACRHSTYVRSLQDLPVQGKAVEMHLRTTRWRCRNPSCQRKPFFGRSAPAVAAYARQTRRAAELVRLVDHAAAGRKDPVNLNAWLNDVRHSGLHGLCRFASGSRPKHRRSTQRGPRGMEQRSDGGQINKLKALKRSMYGRAGTELLLARILPITAYASTQIATDPISYSATPSCWPIRCSKSLQARQVAAAPPATAAKAAE